MEKEIIEAIDLRYGDEFTFPEGSRHTSPRVHRVKRQHGTYVVTAPLYDGEMCGIESWIAPTDIVEVVFRFSKYSHSREAYVSAAEFMREKFGKWSGEVDQWYKLLKSDEAIEAAINEGWEATP